MKNAQPLAETGRFAYKPKRPTHAEANPHRIQLGEVFNDDLIIHQNESRVHRFVLFSLHAAGNRVIRDKFLGGSESGGFRTHPTGCSLLFVFLAYV